MDKPQFININPDEIKAQVKADYEQMTGRTLQPGQVEQLLLNAFAYREYLLRVGINDAALQNLVAFSRAPFLDYLGDLVGVKRLTSAPAVCTMELTLISGHGNLIIPAGIRFQSTDGQAIFTIDNAVSVSSGADTYTVSATCISPGVDANGYAVGKIATILDPQPYLQSVQNTDVTAGGSDTESDTELRERIKLAPQAFSNAGSRGAYEFFARSANQSIIDVSITSPTPGQVNLYPLLKDGVLPNQSVLDEVADACNSEKVRPLTDTVVVQAPTAISYSVDVTLTLLTGAVSSEIKTAVQEGLQKYADSRKIKCGRDVVIDKIIQVCMSIEGVYSVSISSPTVDIVVSDDEVAQCSAINVTVGGYSDE